MSEPDMSGEFFGELKVNDDGRISWPFHKMQVGDWFTVKWSERDPESVRKIASLRAAQLRRRFGVTKHSDEHRGCAVVWRKDDDPDAHRLGKSWMSKRTRFNYEAFRELVFEQYGLNADALDWEKAGKADWDFLRVAAPRAGDDLREALQLDAMNRRFMVELKSHGLLIVRVPVNYGFERWLRERGPRQGEIEELELLALLD